MGTNQIRVATLAIGVVLGAMAPARGARADEHVESAWAWGVATTDVLVPLSLGAVALWGSESELRSSQYVISGFGVFVAGVTVGSIAYAQEWDPVIPLATHGALWGGLDGFLVGGLLDGVRQGRTFATGPLAFGLAGVGALASGWLGTNAVESGSPTATWLAAPAIGAAAGLLLSVVPSIALQYQGRDRTAYRVTLWCIASGISLGLLAGATAKPGDFGGSTSASGPRSFLLPLAWQF